MIVTSKGHRRHHLVGRPERTDHGQTASSNWAQVAQDAGAKVQYVQDLPGPGVELLIQGRVDAIVNDNIAVLDYLATSGTDQVKIAGNAGDETIEQALAFRKSGPRNQQQADDAPATPRGGRDAGEDLRRSTSGADVTVKEGVARRRRGGLRLALDAGSRGTPRGRCSGTCSRGTIPLTIASFLVGLAIAVAAALARLSSIKVLDQIARASHLDHPQHPAAGATVHRLLRAFQVGIDLVLPAAILALSLNVGGYAASGRASILSVRRGSNGAATVIGMDLLAVDAADRAPQATRRRRTSALQHAAR